MLVEYKKYDKFLRECGIYYLDTDDLDDEQYYQFRLLWDKGDSYSIREAKKYL